MRNICFLMDDDGAPKAVVDVTQISDDAVLMMYRLAVSCRDQGEVNRILKAAYMRHGEAFGFVCATAVGAMAEHVLAPAMDAAEAVGLDLWPGLVAARAEAEQALGGAR